MKLNIVVTDENGKVVNLVEAIKAEHAEVDKLWTEHKEKVAAAKLAYDTALDGKNKIKPRVKSLQAMHDMARNAGLGDELEKAELKRPALRGGRKPKAADVVEA